MKKEEIHLYDIKRILWGNAPPDFLLEVLLRTVLIYILAIVVIRLLGKRMSGQLTITEMGVMIMLGAIIAPAAQIPERGLAAGVLIFICILLLQRGLNWWSFRNAGVERLTQGNISMLAKDGVLQLEELRKANIPRQQIYAELREKQCFNLGNVKRIYLEASGSFTIYTRSGDNPGLPVYPARDTGMTDGASRSNDHCSCSGCGLTQRKQDSNAPCPNCNMNDWRQSIL